MFWGRWRVGWFWNRRGLIGLREDECVLGVVAFGDLPSATHFLND